MSTPHVLLGLLVVGARHGYELKRAHDARLPQAKPLAYGQVYSTLGRLERDGYVVPVGQDKDAGPERTSYEITDLGREHLAGWLHEVEPPMPHVTNTLFAKVLVSLLAADEVTARSYLARQRAAHTDQVRLGADPRTVGRHADHAGRRRAGGWDPRPSPRRGRSQPDGAASEHTPQRATSWLI